MTANTNTATPKAAAESRTRGCSNFPAVPAKKSTVAKRTVLARYLAGAIPRLARLADPLGRFSSRRGCLGHAADFIELWHKRVWISRGIREGLLCEPGLVGFLHIGREPLGIISHERFVAGVVGGEAAADFSVSITSSPASTP